MSDVADEQLGCYNLLMIAKFIKSAANIEGCPESQLPEVGFVGRSNAGKSSIINALAKHKNLARVSSSPGKTDLLNFYEIDGTFMLVDMPGYGYAARGQKARDQWTPMIEGYLKARDQLCGVVLIVDICRKWSEDEENLVEWLTHQGLKVVLVLNKADKLNQKELSAKKRDYAKLKGVAETIYASAAKGVGIDSILRSVFDNLIRS